MFGLYGQREVNYIFSNDAGSMEEIARRALDTYSERPGFFTPYKKVSHAVGEFIAPVVYPFAGGTVAVFSVLSAALAATFGIGCLLVAAGASLYDDPTLANEAFDLVSTTLQFIGNALVTAIVAAALGVLSFPHSIASLITRSVATAVHFTTGYTDEYEYPEEDEDGTCLSY
ncbi:hypothetical protein J2N86_10400 [Legionella lytica]|uniref:Integral membrane protein n=1 Tax=Legionella lytica TaxID=96232 RepID=A0ABY4Y798_9GAMM|nr:hypothetical protein [Legionella lytica]USQ13100.1 hypothetical protein J2N86_10400 [Legionella lytica]